MSKLMECKTCGGKLSSSATSCPHCGEDGGRAKKAQKASKKEGTSMFTWLILIGIIAAVAIPKLDKQSTPTSTYVAKPKVHISATKKVQSLSPMAKEKKKHEDADIVLTLMVNQLKKRIKFNAYKTLTLPQLNDRVKDMRQTGKMLNLNENLYKKANSKLYTKAISLQLKEQRTHYPKMRDALGPLMRKKMWEHDVSVKTIGKGYNRMVLTGAYFAANRNIQSIKNSIGVLLSDYRFQRVDFKWMKHTREWTYYDLKNKKDNVL